MSSVAIVPVIGNRIELKIQKKRKTKKQLDNKKFSACSISVEVGKIVGKFKTQKQNWLPVAGFFFLLNKFGQFEQLEDLYFKLNEILQSCYNSRSNTWSLPIFPSEWGLRNSLKFYFLGIFKLLIWSLCILIMKIPCRGFLHFENEFHFSIRSVRK